MVEEDLIIKDLEFINAGKRFKAFCDALEDVILQYKIIMNNVSTNEIPSGETHDAIVKYNEYVVNLEKIAKGIGEKCNSLIASFIKEIERADDYLYDAKVTDTIRDFSADELERLIGCLDDPWCYYTDSFGDFIYDKLNKIIDVFNFDRIKSLLQTCHGLLLDYNDETKAGLELLFNNVALVDKRFGYSIAGATIYDGDYKTCYFAYVDLTMIQLRDMLDIMAEIINPQNGMFTVDSIDDRLGQAYKNLQAYYNQAISIKEIGQQPNVSEISDFAFQYWAEACFSCFNRPMTDFMVDVGGYETFKMYIFNMFQVFGDKVFSVGNYEEYIAKKQLLAVLEDVSENYSYSGSDEKEVIDGCKEYFGYIKKFGSEWYEKMPLDRRTKEAKEFKKFIDGLDGAEIILKYGSQGIELLCILFADYTKCLQILDSFEKNCTADETVLNAVSDIRKLYNKEFKAFFIEIVQKVVRSGVEDVLKEIGKVVPVIGVLDKIDEGINLFGDLTGIGDKAKSMYDALNYYQLLQSSQDAYDNALNIFKMADPESDGYDVLANDLNNCFSLHKKNTVEVLKAMSNASEGTKQSYFKYCAKQAENLTMYDIAQPDILSYDEFLSLGT